MMLSSYKANQIPLGLQLFVVERSDAQIKENLHFRITPDPGQDLAWVVDSIVVVTQSSYGAYTLLGASYCEIVVEVNGGTIVGQSADISAQLETPPAFYLTPPGSTAVSTASLAEACNNQPLVGYIATDASSITGGGEGNYIRVFVTAHTVLIGVASND